MGVLEVEVDGQPGTQARVCHWSGPDSSPQTFQIVTGQEIWFPSPSYDFAAGSLRFGEVLSESGVFLQPIHRVDGVNDLWVGPGEWRMPHDLNAAGVISSDDGLRFIRDGGLRWGNRIDSGTPHQYAGGVIRDGSQTIEFPFLPRNAARLPAGRVLAMPVPEDVGEDEAIVYSNGFWTLSPTFAPAIDISDSGTAIGRNHDGKTGPILINGEWQTIHRTAPDLPEGWRAPSFHLLDTTPGGWVLAQRGSPQDLVGMGHAVMLPFQLDQPEPVAPQAAGWNWDGIDSISLGALAPTAAVRESLWIMAPLGAGESRFVLKSPLNEGTPLKLSGANLLFDGQPEAIISAAESTIGIAATPAAQVASGAEAAVDLHFGDTASASKPIKVKFMKKRTVKVNLYHVPRAGSPPDFALTSSQAEGFLTQIYKPKINVDFEVRPVVTLSDAWDLDNDGAMDALPENDIHAEQQAMLDSRPEDALVSNIDVFLVSGMKFQVEGSSLGALPAWGVANRAQRCCWVHADTLADPLVPGSGRTADEFVITLAHELGHIFTDYGHPDEESGSAPLKGTNRSMRLMHSGEFTRGGRLGTLLVKEEWDAAEAWLQSEEANERL